MEDHGSGHTSQERSSARGRWLRRLLPWAVSAAALAYVFGYAIDWRAIPDATADANLPLFIAITVLDKLLFFSVWAVIQAMVVRRFFEPVPVTRVVALKGGAELLRTLNNPLADAGFALGLSQMLPGRAAAVLAAITIPFGCHMLVLLLQATLMFPLLDGGFSNNRDVLAVLVVGWLLMLAFALGGRFGVWARLLRTLGLATGLDRIGWRALMPFLGWFALFAVADVLIQGTASRAFGVPIPWTSLAARLPILYLALSLPSLGNFGTREIAWAACFAPYGERETLIAFALWTNGIFLLMHVVIGAVFLARALEMVREMRSARAQGREIRPPLLHDAIDP